MTTHAGTPVGELGRILKAWRGLRGVSQIELSLDTGVSQRHLSFIESGRSVPNRQTLMIVADGLDMPFRERNQRCSPSYFSLVTTVGTPRTPGPQELRIECMAPVDAATESWHRHH
jgi:transcriptional regulator with XRE-family HTH domain